MDICIRIADSLCYIAATNTTMQSSYTPIKIFLQTKEIKINKNLNKTRKKQY